MKAINREKTISPLKVLPLLIAALAFLLTASAYAATPGIAAAPGSQDTNFNLTAKAAFITQPDGQAVYSWGYGCTGNALGNGVTFAPSTITTGFCHDMQVPGPTLIVTENQPFAVTLTNALPAAAGNTSILFPGLQLVSVEAGVPGLLTQEAGASSTATNTVTYHLIAHSPGTRAYYSGTQGDLQVEMGLYGAVIVLPSTSPTGCNAVPNSVAHYVAPGNQPEKDYRLAPAAYDNAKTCYDREYLFQFSEMDPRIHRQAEEQLANIASCNSNLQQTNCATTLNVATEPYHPAYFMINGRSMPDNMDPNYAIQYPHQPYNGNPHMHPGELTLIRVIGQGRWQHPFHEHGNHVRILGRDGNLLLTPDNNALAGPLLFTTTTTPGLAFDGIFYWTGKGLNWDPYGHNPNSSDPLAKLACDGKLNGYHSVTTDLNYYEWCQDHNKPVEAAPVGDVAGSGPVTLPDPNILTNGAWFGGSPYLGPDATTRATGPTGTTPPSGTIANPPGSEAGFAFMWHSHNEREITTNNIFPGGMLMMMLVDSREFVIDESF
jgi:FtsP/CotA-like multicopper oxidase with cupredoxin domain